ncbi:hypothetical protein CBM2610_P200001 [Cupriavidus taiwanensis]|nr:hypothetical protein CBM2610_P200001 [Cupriavidus taiwanensis]
MPKTSTRWSALVESLVDIYPSYPCIELYGQFLVKALVGTTGAHFQGLCHAYVRHRSDCSSAKSGC